MNKYASKVRLLRLWQILTMGTTSDYPMKTNDIIERLTTYGLFCDRRTLYRDIELLNEVGYTVKKIHKDNSNQYYTVNRLEREDFNIIMNLINDCNELTDEQKKDLRDRFCMTVAY